MVSRSQSGDSGTGRYLENRTGLSGACSVHGEQRRRFRQRGDDLRCERWRARQTANDTEAVHLHVGSGARVPVCSAYVQYHLESDAICGIYLFC
eukprot:6201601-Pleurochrysis_carterae.AAC.1